jgi:hypothetical protein
MLATHGTLPETVWAQSIETLNRHRPGGDRAQLPGAQCGVGACPPLEGLAMSGADPPDMD